MNDFKHNFDSLRVNEWIDELQKAIKKEPDSTQLQRLIAELQIALSERAEIASQRVEGHTVAMLKLTKGLYWFTAILILFGAIQIVVSYQE